MWSIVAVGVDLGAPPLLYRHVLPRRLRLVASDLALVERSRAGSALLLRAASSACALVAVHTLLVFFVSLQIGCPFFPWLFFR